MGNQEVRPYDPSKDFKLIIDWCIKEHLIYWLKKTRNYTQPTDWINELAKNKNVFIFIGDISGIVEYREIFCGQKGNIARVFWYSPENEAALAQWALEYAFQNGISEIEYEGLSFQKITKEIYNATRNRIQPELPNDETIVQFRTTSDIQDSTVSIPVPAPIPTPVADVTETATSKSTTTKSKTTNIRNNSNKRKANKAKRFNTTPANL